ncbi:MAG: ARMT1-like domain-containing protein [Phycisphaeraceae bacterium]
MDFTQSNFTGPDSTAHNDNAVFPLLADPSSYVACPWDLGRDAKRRAYWIGVFRKHLVSLLEHVISEAAERGADASTQRDDVDRRFTAYLDTVERDPGAFGRLDVLSICWHRENALRAANVADPYRVLKRDENERALALLPAVLEELDRADGAERDRMVIEGVFAGNIFDMGAEHTQKMFEQGQVDFASVRDKLKPRPWRYDALETWSARLSDKPYQAAVLFVDNAGPDVVLGMIPLARDLIRRGTTVVLSANTEPALNDVTHDELVGLIDCVARFDPMTRNALESKRLRLVESGNWAPLIDLTRVSPQLAAVCEELPIDLVVLEGMGRSMESNPDCELTCDCLRLAMVKDLGVAESFDAELFDLVMRYEQVD